MRERLRVLHLLPSFGVGGAEQMAGHLMAGLAKHHDVLGVTLYPATNSPIEHRLQVSGIPMRHLGKRPGFDWKMFSALDAVLEEFQPNVVHTHLSVLRYLFPVMRRGRNYSVVHTLHSMAEHESDRAGRLIQWLAFRRGVYPVAISAQCEASFQRVYGLECSAIVPNCIPVDRFVRRIEDRLEWRAQEAIPADAFVFTSVGRLEEVKNPLLILRAFQRLEDPKAHLVFLGGGRLQQPLLDEIASAGIGNVHVLGKRVTDLPECLAASDVFVLGSNCEGSPLAVMEAMAAGLPVISTAVGGVPELLADGEFGALVPAGEVSLFTGAMRQMMERPQEAAAIGESARRYAMTTFGLDRMLEGYLKVYETALHGSTIEVPAVA